MPRSNHLYALTLVCALNAGAATAGSPTPGAVVNHYVTIAHAVFEDSHRTALQLQQRVDALLAAPSEQTLAAARKAWLAARVPYQQSEVFRFGNPNVDDWEGQVNAWPLDEGLIDYVATDYVHEMGNVGATANIVANPQLRIGSAAINVGTITPQVLAELNELGGSEANVATGYHAIEFLLWGQDRNGSGPGAGNRPYTDYVQGKGCSNDHCDRRAQYLRAVTALLVEDLANMTRQWAAGDSKNYRSELLANDAQQGLTKMLFGMGSLALGELAGERMKVALEANSPEDEHDCFSDNTHHSHYYDALGIRNIYQGRYQRVDGNVLQGPSLSQLLASKNPALDKQAQAAFERTQNALQAMVDTAERDGGMRFDQMIAEGNAAGAQLIGAAIEALVAQTAMVEKVAAAVGVTHLNPDSADHAFY